MGNAANRFRFGTTGGNMAEKPMTIFGVVRLILPALSVVIGGQAYAEPLVNGGFETGSLSGWTVFASSNGTLGGGAFPGVYDFDTTGDGVVTKGVAFKVGKKDLRGAGESHEGGGIFQIVTAEEAGELTITADIAASYVSAKHEKNLAGGRFELLLNNVVLDSHDFGPIPTNSTQRKRLRAHSQVPAGPHEIRLRVTRPYLTTVTTPAPLQFIDNVTMRLSPVP